MSKVLRSLEKLEYRKYGQNSIIKLMPNMVRGRPPVSLLIVKHRLRDINVSIS